MRHTVSVLYLRQSMNYIEYRIHINVSKYKPMANIWLCPNEQTNVS